MSELSDSESDGIKSKSKQRKQCSKYTEKLERIDDTVDELKCKHGSAYNVIQYRVWAETIDAGRHDSLENPSKGSFFKSQGRKGNSRASTPPASSASSASVTEQATLTPGKGANLRSTYIQQIKELLSLSLRNWSYYYTTESHSGCPLTSKVLQLLECHPHFAPTHNYYPESIPFHNSL